LFIFEGVKSMVLLTRTQVAAELKVSTVTLDRFRALGLLPFRKMGYQVFFTPGDIDEFMTNVRREKLEPKPKAAAAV
jgi:hypothetical protein